MPELVVINGNSLLYRGFFAMRVLLTSDRLPKDVVYSFVEMAIYKGTRLERADNLKPKRAEVSRKLFLLKRGTERTGQMGSLSLQADTSPAFLGSAGLTC